MLLVALGLALALPAVPAAAAPTGSIVGTVTDVVSHDSLEGVEVCAEMEGGGAYDCNATASDGTYEIGGLEPGSYAVDFYPPAGEVEYLSRQVEGVAVSEASATVDAALQRAASITGVVTAGGNPVEHVYVCAFDNSSYYGCMETGADGSYRIGGLGPGDYMIGFDAPGNYLYQYYDGKSGYDEADLVTVAEGEAKPNVNAVLQAGGAIAGTVSAVGGDGLGEIEVCARSSGGTYAQGCAETGEDGSYEIIGLFAGDYYVEFFPADGSDASYMRQYYDGQYEYGDAEPVSVTLGVTTPGIDAVMQEAAKITGTVTAAGVPLQYASVCPYEGDATYPSGSCVQTNASGEYALTGLDAGSYKVGFTAPYGQNYMAQYYDGTPAGAPSLAAAIPIPVAIGAPASGIDAAMQEGGQIEGTIEGGGAGFSGASACAYPVGASSSVTCGYADPSGAYTISSLASGPYEVRFTPPYGANYLAQWYEDKASRGEAAQVDVTAGGDPASGIDATLHEGGQLAGTVTDVGGEPVQNVSACAYRITGSYSSPTCSSTDSDGKYAVVGLLTGSYRVEFQSYSSPYLRQYYDGVYSEEEATGVDVTVGGDPVDGIDATMREGGRIEGAVTDAETHAGLEDAYVCAYEATGYYGSSCSYTDGDGEYALTGLLPGRYKIRFESPEGEGYVAQYYEGAGTFATAQPLEIDAEGVREHVDAALQKGGKIAGTVEDEGENPIEDAEACARRAATGTMVECATTEADGSYEIAGLPDGEYKVEFQPPYEGNYLGQYYADAAGFGAAATVSVSGGGTTSPVDAVLHPGAEIAGAVSDESSGPVEEVEVCARQIGGEGIERCTETESDGTYALGGLGSGSYKVYFEPPYGNGYLGQYFDGKTRYREATPVTVTSGGPGASGVDAVLETGGSISGTVTDGATSLPISGANVCAFLSGGEEPSRCAGTNSSGHYSLGPLTEGSYTVRFYSATSLGYLAEYYEDASSEDDATLVEVESGVDQPGIDGALARGGRIAGQVTDAASPGQGLSSAYVCAYSADNGAYSGCANADSDGSYSIGGLTTGQYKVSFSGNGYVGEYYDDASSFADATPVGVTTGDTHSGVDAALQVGGKIKGHVVDPTSEPAPGVEVCAMQGGSTLDCASTNGVGNYAIDGLATGSYEVRFTAGGDCYGPEDCESPNYAPQYWNGKPSAGEAEAVAVEAGATHGGVDATLQTGASISGHVTIAGGGEPASYAEVCIYRGASEESEDCVTANLAGGYQLQGLAAGSYKLSFRGDGGTNLVPEYYEDAHSLAGADAIELNLGEAEEGVDAALQRGGRIAGHVTAATGGADLEAIEVCAYEAGLETALRCTETDFEGLYELDELGAGDYQVRFSAGWICGSQTCDRPDFAPQYFAGATSRAEATPVDVEAGGTHDGVDAAMLAGGSISGLVTEAAGGAPVTGAWVCAYYEGETEAEECTETGPDGTYTISPLAAGPHKVSFEPGFICGFESCTEQDYATQYWNGEDSLATADSVTVTEGEDTPGVDAAMAVPAAPKPVNTAEPQVSGTAAVGQTLSCSHGTWTGSPTYAYQWLRDGSQIADATTTTYEVQGSDAGHGLACRVTASNDGGSASATSNSVAIPPKPANTTLPTVSGTAAVGEELSCAHGAWTGSPTEYAYQWLRDGGSIADATATTYVVQAGDAGHDLACRVTASNGSGSTAATSATVHVPGKPLNTALPSVSGDPAVGEELSCDHGAWEHSPTAYAYEWLLGATPIEGEQDDKYTVRAGDRGQSVSCVVTASNEDGSATATSFAFPIPAPPGAPVSTAGPQISGTAALGHTLSCSNGTWDNTPTSFAYAWLRDGSAISGQANQTYAVQAADAGSELACTVTATNGEGSASATSDSVEVPAKPVNTVEPQINGTLAVDEILTCAYGNWDNNPTEYAFQWLRDGDQIEGAIAETYEVQGTDAGHEFACRVTASNGGGSATRTSAPVRVPAKPVNTAEPQISGTAALGQALSCSHGTWDNTPTSFAYAWLRDGGQIGGATASAYLVQGADQGHALACRVTASNGGGSAVATSGSVQVPAAQNPSPPVNGGGATPIPTPTPTSTPKPKPKHKHKHKHKKKKHKKKKHHKCKKGFKAKRKKVRGKVKVKCVKVKKKGKRKLHR